MVIPAGAEERRRIAHALRDLESEHACVERERALDVGDLQVNMSDVNAGIDGLVHG